jgi:hypothetical protein
MTDDSLHPSTNGVTGTLGAQAPVGAAGVSAVEIAEAITASAAARPSADTPPPEVIVDKHPMGGLERGVVGGSLMLATLLLLTQVLAIWPAVVVATAPRIPGTLPPEPLPTPLLFGLTDMAFDHQVVLIAMVLMVGALGALVGSSRRFLYFATRDELTKRDEWSYLIRPLQGATLALIVYFTLRGGYLGQDQSSPVNPYGVAALSALVGLFTRHAVSKLTDVFDTLFGKPKEDVGAVHVKDAEPAAPDQG